MTEDHFVRSTCEYETNPVGLQTQSPRFGWVQKLVSRDQSQTAYQLCVFERIEDLQREDALPLWDTGKRESDDNSNVFYEGPALQPAAKYYWAVRLWDEHGRLGDWSSPAFFVTGLFQDRDWSHAQWLAREAESDWSSHWNERERLLAERYGDVNRYYLDTALWEMFEDGVKPRPASYFRAAFRIDRPVRSAYLFAAALGTFEVYLNGTKAGDAVLENGLVEFDKRILYSSYDVANLLEEGDNRVGIWLGRGWFNPLAHDDWNYSKAQWAQQPKAKALLKLIFEDGTTKEIYTGADWEAGDSPIVWDDPRSGEIFDARLNDSNWCRSYSGTDASIRWEPATLGTGSKGVLEARRIPPEKAVLAVKPIAVHELAPGAYLYDFGQAFSGWARLSIKESSSPGTRITMSWSDDVRRSESEPFQYKYGSWRYQQHIYLTDGSGNETYEPRSSYHAGRYLLLEGYPGLPDLDTVEGKWIRTDLRSIGSFRCSDENMNALQSAVQWTIGSLLHGYPQDCPHREKNGWLDYSTLALDATMLNFDSPLLLESWAADIRLAQRDEGHINVYIPHADGCWGEDIVDPVWGSAIMLVPWKHYVHYGDSSLLAKQYDAMVRFRDYAAAKRAVKERDWLISGMFGDWLPPGKADEYPEEPFPPEGTVLVASAYYYLMTDILARSAALLGKTDDALRFTSEKAAIANEINQYLYDSNAHAYHSDKEAPFRQTSQVIPLALGIVPEADKSNVLDRLVHHIVETNEGRLDTGTIGTAYLLGMLAENGQAELAYKLATQRQFPGWGYFLSQGHTSIPEDWYGKEGQSLIHSCYVGVGSYLYHYVAGIRGDSAHPGFKRVLIKPYPQGEGLNEAHASIDTVRGVVEVRWVRTDSTFELEAIIPPNATAIISVPLLELARFTITEGGTTVWQEGAFVPGLPGIRSGWLESGYVSFLTGAGCYRFERQGAKDEGHHDGRL